jgi:hypothetical protein
MLKSLVIGSAIFVGFAWFGWSHAAEISKHANDSATLNAIAFRGEMIEGDAFRLKSYISRLPLKKTTAIYLDSPGGVFMEGMDIGRFLHRAGIRTVTEGHGASCFSACAFAFLGGYDAKNKVPWRTKASTSNLGFHSYFFRLDQETYSKAGVEEMLAASQMSALTLISYFREVDAPDAILLNALSKKSDELYAISNSEALETGINVWDEVTSEMVYSSRLDQYVKP